MSKLSPAVISTRLRIAWDQVRPDKPVRRTVRGLEMWVPRRHLVPHLVTEATPYARNLVDLCGLVGDREGSLVLLDVGANVGDSTLFVLDRVAAEVVCVEGDPQWQEYLRANVGKLAGVEIAETLLVPPGDERNLAITHAAAGSSHVAPSDEPTEGTTTIDTDELLRRHPVLAGVRVVKTDTDGFDVVLTPAMARTFAASRPLLFLEFDPAPTRLSTPDVDPHDLWRVLDEMGYESALVWDNGGGYLGASRTAELLERSKELDLGREVAGCAFWDVAVAHRDDAVGVAVLKEMAQQKGRWDA